MKTIFRRETALADPKKETAACNCEMRNAAESKEEKPDPPKKKNRKIKIK